MGGAIRLVDAWCRNRRLVGIRRRRPEPAVPLDEAQGTSCSWSVDGCHSAYLLTFPVPLESETRTEVVGGYTTPFPSTTSESERLRGGRASTGYALRAGCADLLGAACPASSPSAVTDGPRCAGCRARLPPSGDLSGTALTGQGAGLGVEVAEEDRRRPQIAVHHVAVQGVGRGASSATRPSSSFNSQRNSPAGRVPAGSARTQWYCTMWSATISPFAAAAAS